VTSGTRSSTSGKIAQQTPELLLTEAREDPIHAKVVNNGAQPRDKLSPAAGVANRLESPEVVLAKLLAHIYKSVHRLVIVESYSKQMSQNEVGVAVDEKTPGSTGVLVK
jgi:hypothetical protein